MVFDSNAYKAVISNGLVPDREGNKMSKRLGNAVNPLRGYREVWFRPAPLVHDRQFQPVGQPQV